jgi:hypothetical protein
MTDLADDAQVLEDIAHGHLTDALYGVASGSDALLRVLVKLLHGFVPDEVLLAEADRIRRAL